jgi:hypothetical protein
MKQAVSVLLKADRVMIDNGNPDNHGEKRYLQKVLVKGAGALQKTGSEGNVAYFTCETDPSKIHDNFPVLKELTTQLSDLEPGNRFSLGTFFDTVLHPPYGAGGTQLMLSVAFIIRAYGERLIGYKDTTEVTELYIDSYDDLVNLVSDPATHAVFKIRKITESQKKLIDAFAVAVGAPQIKHGEERSLQSVFQALFEWWRSLPAVSGIVTMYDLEVQKRIGHLKNIFSQPSSNKERFHFLLELLPSIYRGGLSESNITEEEAETIGKAFASDVQRMNTASVEIEMQVAEAVSEVFGSSGDMITCEQAIKAWFTGLNPRQRDHTRYSEQEASSLIFRLQKDTDFRKTITELLPDDYGFGPVKEWTSLHLQDYAAKLKQAKDDVEEAKIVVPVPEIKKRELELRENTQHYITVPKGAKQLKYTVDGTDPKSSSGADSTDFRLNVSSLLKGKPMVRIQVRAIDSEGNYSDPVSLHVINEDRKHDIQVKEDNGLFHNKEAVFTVPENLTGLLSVITSILRYGKEHGILSPEQAAHIEKAINDTPDGDS